MAEILKFIHASDLHLDRPFQGVADAPSHIRASLIDAAYNAAEKLFDRALSERVDFVCFQVMLPILIGADHAA